MLRMPQLIPVISLIPSHPDTTTGVLRGAEGIHRARALWGFVPGLVVIGIVEQDGVPAVPVRGALLHPLNARDREVVLDGVSFHHVLRGEEDRVPPPTHRDDPEEPSISEQLRGDER